MRVRYRDREETKTEGGEKDRGGDKDRRRLSEGLVYGLENVARIGPANI
jgi:hypothetical protein